MSFDFHAKVGQAVLAEASNLRDQNKAFRNDDPAKAEFEDLKEGLFRWSPATARAVLELANRGGLAELWREGWRTGPSRIVSGAEFAEFRQDSGVADITWLPEGSWTLGLDFQLKAQLLTKDDEAHYVIENPVRKERLTGRPMVSATSWKGCLRAGFRACFDDKERVAEERLFGNRKNDSDDEEGTAGRLCFYSTFFNKIDFAVLAPHDRKKKSVVSPILYEAVPAGSKGRLQVAYVPYFPSEEAKVESEGDLKLFAGVVETTLNLLGIGAKTSSGFGGATVLGGEVRKFGSGGVSVPIPWKQVPR